MQIVNLTDKNRLNEFVIRTSGSFLESWEWGEFQERVGGRVRRFGVEENDELVAVATIIKKSLPLGRNYFYCPKGPVIGIKNYELRIMNFLLEEIKRIVGEEKIIFLRFEPPIIIHNSLFNIQKIIDVQPSKTLILDLSKSGEELLKAMHEKTRYNIRLSEKKGVKIIEAGKEKFDDFWKLMEETGGRDDFRLHGRDYYSAMLKNRNSVSGTRNRVSEAAIRLFFAEYEGKMIAAGIFSFFGDTATYLHGGSANEFRNVMAPYLLQWQVIKLAKSLGYKYYDFYGIDEEKWPGVTRFKKGFTRLDLAEPRRSGEEKNYPGTFDAVFNKGWYNIYRMVRSVRRKM